MVVGLSKTKLYRETIRAALDLHARKPWSGLSNGHAFVLRLPGEEYPWFGTVMGGGGEEFGLSLTRGPDAALQQAVMLSMNPEEFDKEDFDYLGFTIDPLCEVPPEMRKVLEKAKFPARRETLVPFFIVKEPHRRMRSINQIEAERLLYILKAILKTLETGDFRPWMFGPNCDILTLAISGDPLDPEVVVTREKYDIPVGAGSEFAEPEDPSAVPEDNDLECWKEVDLRVTGRIARAVDEWISDKTMEKYFGSLEDAEGLLMEYGPEGAQACFVDWLGCEYRPKRFARTVAESLLAGELPEADRLLLQTRAAAVPTFCRVTGTEGPHTVLLENVFSGEAFAAHDRMLAESLRRAGAHDVILPVRHYAAGNFRFLAMIGPNFSVMHLPHVLAYLEDEGQRPSKKGFEKKPHLLGRIWFWHDEIASATGPKMCNTDGDPIEWHTASYEIKDEHAFCKALEARPDVESEDEDSGVYIWFREEKNPKPGMGDRTLLGRIELVGGEAITEVNSEERHKKLRKWLSKLQGVKFLDVRRRDMREMMDDQPLDDEMNPPEPMEITPEIAAALNEQFRDYYMNWLDEPIPMLEGKTPRQACKTKTGKAKVSALIRGMGPPMMDGNAHGVDIPREAMLRELGLD